MCPVRHSGNMSSERSEFYVTSVMTTIGSESVSSTEREQEHENVQNVYSCVKTEMQKAEILRR